MSLHYTQVFLLAWILVFWVYHFATYGRIEGRHERSVQKQYGIRGRWSAFFGLVFFAWTAVIILYFFSPDSVVWVGKLSFLDRPWITIVAVAVLGFALLLYVLFTLSVGRSIRHSLGREQRPALVTTGMYRFCRHPAYLALLLVAVGVFLVVANLVTALLLVYTFVITHAHAAEEERKLLAMYGSEYQEYRRRTGRFLPRPW